MGGRDLRVKIVQPDRLRFLDRIGRYRRVDIALPSAGTEARPTDSAPHWPPVGCTILRSVQLWPKERWIPWGEAAGWARNIVQGKTEMDSARATRLLGEMQASDQLVPDLDAGPFELVVDDERRLEQRTGAVRDGQGTFRARLLDAYGRSCAITGEHTQPVLDAAHIQPYLGPRSNHVQNGLLLTNEFHTLFDLG